MTEQMDKTLALELQMQRLEHQLENVEKIFPAKKNQKLKVTQTTLPQESETDLSEVRYPLLKYAGIRKIIESLTKGQRKVMLFLIDPQNQNQSFTLQQIALSLGYTNPLSLTVHPVIPPLVKKGYIIKVDNTYKQNFSSMI